MPIAVYELHQRQEQAAARAKAVFSTPVWEDFMAANGEVIKEAELIANSTQVTICSD